MDKVTVLNYYYIVLFQLILDFLALNSEAVDVLKNLEIICINDLPHGLSSN